jgi:alpha-1,2-mannosyltransferase
VAQFRPEKDHPLQLKAFRLFLDKLEPEEAAKSRLILVGSCRNQEDEDRVQALRDLTKELDIQTQVEFKLNVSFEEMLDLMGKSNVGIHTMNKEHFGIGIVECMAAGLVMLAHNSGGPQMDIITPKETGFLATSAEEYSEALFTIVHLNQGQANEIRRRARLEVRRFSEERFQEAFFSATKIVFSGPRRA